MNKIYQQLLDKFDLVIGDFFEHRKNIYLVKTDGIYKRIADTIYKRDDEFLVKLLTGEIPRLKQWIPNKYDNFYSPSITNSNLYVHNIWIDDVSDNRLLENNLVYKTKEEAIFVSKKLLDTLKNSSLNPDMPQFNS